MSTETDTKSTSKGIHGLTLEGKIARLPDNAESRLLRKSLGKYLNDLNTYWGSKVAVFESGCHLDCMDGYEWRATGTGVVTYALNLESNLTEGRTSAIEYAKAAEYQKNSKGGWIWEKNDMYNDCINIILAGVRRTKIVPALSEEKLAQAGGLQGINPAQHSFSSAYLHF